MSKARSYCFTINNYTSDDLSQLEALPANVDIKYLIYGKEIGELGTPHIQGYVSFASPISSKSFCKKLIRAHVEIAKGTAEQNKIYCSKEGDFVEIGIMPSQGKRSDIDSIRQLVNEGKGMEQIIDIAQNYQSIKIAESLLKYKEKKRDFKPIVKWFYGATGTGKTREAYSQSNGKRIYAAMETSRWFDGYDAHEVLIIDDMRHDFIKFNNLLKLLDRYEYRVETKGGSRQMLAKEIYITCPMHPRDLFTKTTECIEQLLRRIDEIREFI